MGLGKGKMFLIRGIRGATTIEVDTPEEVVEATRELLAVMVERNGIDRESIAAVIFRLLPTLNQSFLRWRRGRWAGLRFLCFVFRRWR